MESGIPRRTFRTERDFGLMVGGVLTALGGWWIFRARFQTLSYVFLACGILLVLLGMLLPRSLVLPFRLWMLVGEILSFVMTRVILAIVYFTVVTPIGIAKRLTGWDPLQRRAAPAASYWKDYSERQHDTKHYQKMY
ncbi:MAG: SxtJ family membrane protein [Pyrinomonadaceae bacterium]